MPRYVTSTDLAPQRGAQRGEFTGTVYCPQRWSGIAVMKCWEYQTTLGCGFGCASAVKRDVVEVGQASSRVGEDQRPAISKSRRARETCACGGIKSPQSKTCSSCYHASMTRLIEYYGACKLCGDKKPRNKWRRCRKCSQSFRADRGWNGARRNIAGKN
jgi:hypothetical protein